MSVTANYVDFGLFGTVDFDELADEPFTPFNNQTQIATRSTPGGGQGLPQVQQNVFKTSLCRVAFKQMPEPF